MKLKTLINISENYFKNRNRFRFQVFIVFTLMFFLLFFIITFSSTFHSTVRRIFSTEDNTYITIEPKDMDVGIFKFNTPSILGKGKLTEKDIEYFETLENVSEVSATYSLDAPAHLSGQLFDFGYGTDLSIFGEERPYKGLWYSKSNTKEVRAVASSKLLDIYNSSFAPANSLPKLTENILIGRKFDLVIGTNSFRHGDKTYSMKVTVIGLDKDVPFLGLTLPETILRQIAAKIDADIFISGIKVYFDNPSDLLGAVPEIEKRGYKIVENENEFFRTINKYISRMDYFLYLPVLFIILIISLFVQNQIRYMLLYLKREIGIQMAIGAFEGDIMAIWLYQYSKYIFFGLISGSGISFVIIRSSLLLYDGGLLTRVIVPEYNIAYFLFLSLIMTAGAVTYIFFRIRSFLKENSIIGLMAKD